MIGPLHFTGLLSLRHKDEHLNVIIVNYITSDYFSRKIQLSQNPKCFLYLPHTKMSTVIHAPLDDIYNTVNYLALTKHR